MKITTIKAHNLTKLRARFFEIPAEALVVMFAGPNGSGKSSLLEGIRFAITGEMPRGVSLKKDLHQVITRGESKGSVAVTLERDGVSDEYMVNLKTGVLSDKSPSLLGSMALTLSPQSFMALQPAERRRALFAREGISVKPEAVLAALEKEGHPGSVLSRIKSALPSGFDKAAVAAKEMASEARGSWQAITGETYGTNKAETWKADVPVVFETVQEAKAALDALQLEHAQAAENFRQLESDLTLSRDRAHHEEMEKSIPGIRAEITNLEERIAAKNFTIAQATETAPGGWTCECPSCGTALQSQKPGHLQIYAPSDTSPVTAAAAAAQARKDLGALQQSKAAANNRLEHALGSKQLLLNMPERPTDEEVSDARKRSMTLQEQLRLARDAYEKTVRDDERARTAEERTAKATAFHADQMAFTTLSKALEVMPGKYLEKALGGINDAMAVVSVAFDETVSIDEDMVLRYGSTPYHLAAESEQWRADLALGIALAQTDGGVVLMDRFDVLEPAARGLVLEMLIEVGVQVILGATLKARPKLPAGYHVEWLGADE